MTFAPRILLAPFALFALAVAAQAQSSATSFGTHDFSFSVDPGSVGSASDLAITDDGDVVYNLIDGSSAAAYFQPYTARTGTGTAYANPDGTASYDPATQSGHVGIDSGAGASAPSGTADASVGLQREITFENTGTDDVVLDVASLVRADGAATATGASTATNFANVRTFAGVGQRNLIDGTFGTSYYVLTSGSDATGVSTTAPNGEYTPTIVDGDQYYQANFKYTFAPGARVQLNFYTSSVDHAAASPVPEPSGLAALGFGAVAILRRRRKA